MEEAMKSLLFALVAALLVAGQIFTPAAATAVTATAVTAAPSAAATCGATYTVQRGDYLSKIANFCGVTLSQLISANPEITNINRIFPGQVIRITNDTTIPVTGGATYTVVKGDTLFLIAVRFGTTVSTLMRLNPMIVDPSIIFVGQVITLPSNAGAPRITLSTRSVKPGGTVTVTVSGFPSSASIDFRLGKSGQAYSVVVDGKTDASGVATAKLTIPASAAAGQLWVVRVLTTEQRNEVGLNSATISIY